MNLVKNNVIHIEKKNAPELNIDYIERDGGL